VVTHVSELGVANGPGHLSELRVRPIGPADRHPPASLRLAGARLPRHEAVPEQYDPPEVYETEPRNRSIWEYLARLERPDVCFVAADRPHSEVYEKVREHVSAAIA
jgi:hypothetical protein